MKIEQIEHADAKQTIARQILETLPEWFGLEDARESYIRETKRSLLRLTGSRRSASCA